MKRGLARGSGRVQKSEIDGEIFLQPWFVPQDVFLEIRRLLPNVHLSKMRYYFEDYGCLRCGTKDALYGSNGLCERCSVLIRGRVKTSLKRRLKNVGVASSDHDFSGALGDGMTSARALLQDLTDRRASAGRPSK